MKRYLKLILLIFAVGLQAQPGFDEGNTLYQKEKYAEAAAAYESVIQSGKQSADVYFNLGNAYYKQNKVAPAIYNYRKALVLKPNDQEISNNLKFAQKLTIDEIKEVPKVGFSKILRDFTGRFTYDGWAWLSVALAVSFLLVFIGYYFAGTTLLKRTFFIGMFVVLFGIGITTLSAASEKSHYETERPAVVFADAADVKSEPRATASGVFVLHEGTTVMVMEQVRDWDRIELLDGSDGWIEGSKIREVK